MKLTRCLLCLASLGVLSGCYHYVPSGTLAATQGTPVRVRLASPQSFELSTLTAHNIGTMTAEIVRVDNRDVVVSATWLDAVTGEGFSGENWTFTIPRGNIADLQVRTLSSWRTAAVLIGGAIATYVGFHRLRGSDAIGGTGGLGGSAR